MLKLTLLSIFILGLPEVSSILLKKLFELLQYQPREDNDAFILQETAREDGNPEPKEEQTAAAENTPESPEHPKQALTETKKTRFRKVKFPRRPRAQENISDKPAPPDIAPEDKAVENQPGEAKQPLKQGWGEVSHRLEFNREKIKDIYDIPKNKDFVIRDFYLGLEPPVKAFALFMEGLTDKNLINMTVLQPLMVLTHLDGFEHKGNLVDFIKDKLLPGNQINKQHNYKEIVDAVNFGSTAIFLEGCHEALLVETKGWEHRNVSSPRAENVIRGPHEAFNEVLRVNTGLIRKQLRSHELITEMFKIGARNNIDVAIMYVRTVANQALVKEVIRRVTGIKADYIADSGVLEQFIEDHPYSLVPQVIATERPDRVNFYLTQGRVAILLDGSPYALVVPGTLFEQLHTPEDYYLRPSHGTLMRLVRTFAFYTAFLLPGVYLSIVLFHQEMIPTDLLLAIAGARDKVPFPSLVEVIIMEISFELIREAGIRIPGVLGSTIGIVGALILGQAAVQANIVSPILIIVTAVTALASFSVPNYSLQFALRIARFAYILLGAFLGFFGITLGLFYHISIMAAQKSFGVPYIVPAAPQTNTGKGSLIRAFVWNKENRPDYLQVKDTRQQPKVSRRWLKESDRNKTDR